MLRTVLLLLGTAVYTAAQTTMLDTNKICAAGAAVLLCTAVLLCMYDMIR